MPVRVPPKLQRRRKGHDGVVGKTFETAFFCLAIMAPNIINIIPFTKLSPF